MPAKRFDKPDYGGERRTQFMAGAGDEISAHLFNAALTRKVANEHEGSLTAPGAQFRSGFNRRNIGAARPFNGAHHCKFNRNRII